MWMDVFFCELCIGWIGPQTMNPTDFIYVTIILQFYQHVFLD